MKPGTCRLARSRSLGLARFRSHALIVSTRARWLKAKAPERGPQHSLAAWPLLLCCCLVRISIHLIQIRCYVCHGRSTMRCPPIFDMIGFLQGFVRGECGLYADYTSLCLVWKLAI